MLFNDIKQKTEARDSLVNDMQTIIDASNQEKRSLTDEESDAWNTKSLEVEKLDKELEVLKKQHALNASRAVSSGPVAEEKEVKAIKKAYSVGKAILEFSRNGKLTGLEAEMHQEADAEYRTAGKALAGFGIPSTMLKRADIDIATGADALISFQSNRVSILTEPTVLEKAGARFLTGLSSSFELPKVTQATATFVAEKAPVLDGGAVISKVSLTPRRVGVGQPFTKEYLSQSNPAVTSTIISDLNAAIMRAVNNDGFATMAAAAIQTLNASGAAPLSSMTWSDWVQLEAGVEVDNANFGNLNYITTHSLKASAKTTYKDSPGSGLAIWTGDNMINGYGALSTNFLPAKAVYYGNWDDLVIGSWGGLDIVTDSITMAREGMIDVIASALYDSVIVNEESFVRILDAENN